MTPWKLPPKIKIYEALGALADNRIEVTGNTATVTSSSGNKSYTVTYDPASSSIMTNDNGSYWQGYLGYPAITYLMDSGFIPYDPALPPLLTSIKWKDINQQFKNNWDKTEGYCHDLVVKRGGNLAIFLKEIDQIYQHIESNPLNQLGKRTRPPSGY